MYLSIRDCQAPHAGFPDLKTGLDELGVSAVELAMDREFKTMGLRGDTINFAIARERERFQNEWTKAGVRATSFLLANDFSRDDAENEVEWVAEVIRIADDLGIPSVRIDAMMHHQRDMTLDQQQKMFADCMKQVLEETDECVVKCGIENHGFPGNEPDFLRGLIESVGSKRLGLTLDFGNFYWAGFPLDRVYEILEWGAAHTVHTHIKNINYPEETRNTQRERGWEYGQYVSPLAQGDIDLARVVKMLKTAGYDGDICIEDESLGKFPAEDRKRILREDVVHMRACMG